MSTRNPDPTDHHVGTKIRHARLAAGLSQTELGAKVGVTFQQIQKYEKGVNRVSAGRLAAIASLFGRPITWFLEGAAQPTGGVQPADDPIADLAGTAQGMALARAFTAIRDPVVRRSLVDHIEAVAAAQPEAQPVRRADAA